MRLWPGSQTATRSPGLQFNGLHPHNPCNNYMDYYSFTNVEGMESWVGLLGWTAADTLPTKWSHISHKSRKVCQPKTDVLTTEPCCQTLLANGHFLFLLHTPGTVCHYTSLQHHRYKLSRCWSHFSSTAVSCPNLLFPTAVTLFSA